MDGICPTYGCKPDLGSLSLFVLLHMRFYRSLLVLLDLLKLVTLMLICHREISLMQSFVSLFILLPNLWNVNIISLVLLGLLLVHLRPLELVDL